MRQKVRPGAALSDMGVAPALHGKALPGTSTSITNWR